MEQLNLRVNPVRYFDHSGFYDVTPEKIEEMIRGYEPDFRNLLKDTLVDFPYANEFVLEISGNLPNYVDPSVTEALPEDQQNLIKNAHDLCSSENFWEEVSQGKMTVYHFVEHCIMAVYLKILSGIVEEKFAAVFLTYPEHHEDRLRFRIYILQNSSIAPTVFMDIMILATEYANSVVTMYPMDEIFALIQRKIEKYPLK